MTVTRLFKKHLKQTIAEGKSHEFCDHLAGIYHRIVLTEAEAEAGKRTFQDQMNLKLWHDPQWNSDNDKGWQFGTPKSQFAIGLVPSKLAKQRKGINMADWDSYTVVE